MKYLFPILLIILFSSCKRDNPGISTPGLQEAVEILRDSNGVNHIYAKNEHDLFFAQGYAAAKDRLFQFEIWRRQATGTVAEILGPRELKRDIGSRLFKYRGDLDKEFNHYHPRGKEIILAFTDGINAYIAETEKNPALLPMEFRLLDIKPLKWTPEVVISRHQGLLGNLPDEVRLARAVKTLGVPTVKQLSVFEPGEPMLDIDPKIKKDPLPDSVIALYDAYRKALRFSPDDLHAQSNPDKKQYESFVAADDADLQEILASEKQNIGSNNWIVSARLSESGFPLLANDPHRAITAPSLRYMVHLNAPGWNVVGGGEPTIPGISIGHNEDGAWGLTIFSIDGEDLYVYELNPENPNQYRYNGSWEDFKMIKDTIAVRGQDDVFVDHKFTRHGPVTFIDSITNTAYAVRCAWMEPGGAPYLASLRIDQAKTWDEFRDGCSYSHIPGENMIWADKKGNIGWQAVGIAPIRKSWSGLIPVPGDGSYEWDGYLPIKELPNVSNPEKGFWVTANENLIPQNYPHRDAVGWSWADKFRANRISEAIEAKEKHSSESMMKIQFDYLSLPARTLVPLLKNVTSKEETSEIARKKLLEWNFTLDKNSVEAAIYVAWEKRLSSALTAKLVPQNGKDLIRSIPLSKIIAWTVNADPIFGSNPKQVRDQFLINCLDDAIHTLTTKLGADMSRWQYGQDAYHYALIKHPLSNSVNEETRKKLNVGPLPRGGYASTPGVTSNNDNQSHGASFRIVTDVADWDKTMFTNTPGQSGNPESPYYKNLFEGWANDRHFRVYFTRSLVEKSTQEKLLLNP